MHLALRTLRTAVLQMGNWYMHMKVKHLVQCPHKVQSGAVSTTPSRLFPLNSAIYPYALVKNTLKNVTNLVL